MLDPNLDVIKKKSYQFAVYSARFIPVSFSQREERALEFREYKIKRRMQKKRKYGSN